ncbi:NB-ARC domain-containing protein [Pseudoflavonifractor sp.]|jgi:tetratricopeptide (TPR) repeat protein|uniref:NB-ARC domain-containing protein n=1 Tax=Pseudoflavonifractor sp. TaxID=1980281 RepID=UPI003D8DA8E5
MHADTVRPDGLSTEQLLTPQEGLALGLDRELIWSWNQIVLQSRYPDTPPGFSGPEEQQRAVALWEEQYAAYRRTHEHALFPRPILPPEQFVGREEELAAIHRQLSGGSGPGRVLLHGMGGLGKTTLARAYAARFAGAYGTVVWLNVRQDLTHTFCDDGELNIRNLSWNSGQYADQAQYFKKKWKVFTGLLENRRVLLILDDVNQLKDRVFPLLWQLPCALLMTGRVCGADWPVAVHRLPPLDRRYWRDFYRCCGQSPLTPGEIQRLDAFCAGVQGNPLLMRLALCSPDQPPALGAGKDDLTRYFIRRPLMSQTDIRVLRCLALLPAGGMETGRFLRASGLKAAALERLCAMSLVWVRQQDGQSLCGLHPVIAESVRRCYPPAPENCRRFLRGMQEEYAHIWDEPYGEVVKAVPVCFSLLDAWPTPRAWLADSYDTFATVLWIGGYFGESLQYMLRLYQSCEEHYGAVHQVTGSIAMRVGAVYHNSMQFSSAKAWYQKALEILRKCRPYNALYFYRLAQAAHKMCRNDRHEGRYVSALAYCREALEAFGRYENLVGHLPLPHRKTGYFLHLEQAKLLACRRQYRQALEVCRQLREDFCTEPFGEQRHFSVELDLLRAEILLRQGEVPGAMELARSCTEVTQAMRGEAAKETLSCQEVLADAWAAAGEAEAARTLYRQILHKLTQYYPRQTQWYETLREKEAAL